MLTRTQLHIHQLFILERYEIGIEPVATYQLAGFCIFFQPLAIFHICLAVIGKRCLGFGKTVDYGKLVGRFGQQLVLMLRMYVHKPHRYLPKHGERHRRIVDKGTRTSPRQQLPAQYAVGITAFKKMLAQELVDAGGAIDAEHGFNHRFTARIAHHLHVSPASEQKRQSPEDYRLARTGFAGNYVKTGRKLYVKFAYECIICYM